MKGNNNYQWTYCNMSTIQGNGDFIFTCAGVGEGWRRISNINISAGDDCPTGWTKATQSGFTFCRVWPVTGIKFVLLPVSLLME